MQKHHLSMILDIAEEAIVSVNERQEIQYFNHGAEKIFGYTADEVLGRSLSLLLPPSMRGSHHSLLHDFATSSIKSKMMDERSKIKGLRKDGSEFPAEASISKIETPEGTLYTAILRDNTERIRMKEELQQAHDELEQRVQVRTKELKEAKEEAERANRAKTEFLSRMSHELRTPLNAVLGFGQLLELDDYGSLSDTKKGFTKDILSAGNHLLDLINEVLDLSRIEIGNIKIEIESIDCHELMHECVVLIKPMADKHGVDFEDQTLDSQGLMLRAERTRLKEVILNLLTNAVKYNREHGKVSLGVKELPEFRIRIFVSDTGMGLSKEQQERLFKPFERLGAEYSTIEGTGIGLAISKRLVELMGGEIGVDSTPDQGSTFWVELNQALEKDMAQEPKVTQLHKSKATENTENQYTLLYIEDSPSSMRLVEFALKSRRNITLLSAMTPEEGLKLATEFKPDLILLDINLPGMDGYEVLDRLRTMNETSDIPAIAISALAMSLDIERMEQVGFDDYLTKPFDLDHFYEKVDRMIA